MPLANIKVRLLAIIPTFNEQENVRTLVENLDNLKLNLDILFVDGQSNDGTQEIIRSLIKSGSEHIHLLVENKKSGLASAYLAGFYWAISNNYDYVIQMDCDGSHRALDLARMVNEIEPNTLVLGSRYIPGGSANGWNKKRIFLSYSANLFIKKFLGIRISDMTTGFKVLPQNAVLDILKEQIQSVGYVFQIEVNIKCKIKGYNLTEIPIIFVDRQHGKSKLNLKIIYEALRLIFKWKFQYRLNEAE